MTVADVEVRAGPRVCADNLPLRFGSSYDAAVVYDASADELTLQTKDGSGSFVDRLTVRAGTDSPVAVFNDPGADADWRMEGDTDPELFHMDASADGIGIGIAAPVHKLTVGGFESPTQQGMLGVKARAAAGGFDANIHLEEASGQEGWAVGVDADGDLNFHNSGGATPAFKIVDSSNAHFIGSAVSNSWMTGPGMTVNQGTNDGEATAWQSDDVAHGMTTRADTKTFGAVQKVDGAQGGLRVAGFGGSQEFGLQLIGASGASNTAKTSSAVGHIMLDAGVKSGTDWAAVGANGNMVVIRHVSSGAAVGIWDAEGDVYADGSGLTIYDEYDDIALVRAFDLARAAVKGSKGAVLTKWDRFVRYNERTLVELGILGAPLAEGGLTNVTRLQKLHNGAIWQLGQRLMETDRRLGLVQARLDALPAGA